jgi:hypothetical protein
MNIKRNAIIAAVGAVITLGSLGSASAETQWQYQHPRRAEVIDRLHNQFRRIRDERKEGEISPRQAFFLHREDRRIYRQEQRDAYLNGGRLTRGEQHALNREENGVSGQIGR